MSKRIYVGNLPWSVGKDRLKEAFSKFGDIEEATVITNKYTGRSRGFGFVTYKNDADGKKAISEMHEKDLDGRKVLVKEARPMKKDISADAGAAKTSEEEKADKKGSSDKSSEESKEDSQPEKETEDKNEDSEEASDKSSEDEDASEESEENKDE